MIKSGKEERAEKGNKPISGPLSTRKCSRNREKAHSPGNDTYIIPEKERIALPSCVEGQEQVGFFA